LDSNAPGQLLGYALQIPRALVHLLQGGPGDIVWVEFLGDVAKLKPDAQLISEEDKSSISANPLTDKSADLWKTFYNWISAINDSSIDINKTNFILYTNQRGRLGIVNLFHGATTKEESKRAIAEAKEKLKNVDQAHVIWKYYDFVVNEHEELLVEVIRKFELQIGSGAGYDEVQNELTRKHISSKQIPFLIDSISGWLFKKLMEGIANKHPAKIEWEAFDKQIKVLFERIRGKELIDFTLQEPINEQDKQQQMKIGPCYLKQLEAIGCNSDEIIEAVTDFLRAKVNRDKWIEEEIIDEAVASDFQQRLVAFWKNQRKKIELTEHNLNDDEQGQLLLLDCKNRQEKIRGEDPPSSTIAGTYHKLADEPVLGWHPQWKNKFSK
jgi:hypothetical protein